MIFSRFQAKGPQLLKRVAINDRLETMKQYNILVLFFPLSKKIIPVLLKFENKGLQFLTKKTNRQTL